MLGTSYREEGTEAEQWTAVLEGPFATSAPPRPGHDVGPDEAWMEAPWQEHATDEGFAGDEAHEWFSEHEAPSTPGGRLVVGAVPLLRRHTGTPPDLVLRWNAMTAPAAVDVVVHLHGYSGRGRAMRLDADKERMSGLDFVDPTGVGGPGRTRPTVGLLPRGNFFGGRSGAGYDFPALVQPGALRELMRIGVEHFAVATGVRAPVGRLILTAHSGGGAALMAILRHEDPDEVHTFDALYGNPAALVEWARRRIGRDAAAGSTEAGGGGMRILYRPGEGTAANSAVVHRALCPLLASSPAAGLGRRYRVEQTRVPHNDIPPRFGWRLLTDVGGDLPGVSTLPCGRTAGAPSAAPTVPAHVARFFADHYPHAARSQQVTGVPWLVTLGQAAVESAWGRSAPHNNFFGIKARATDPPESRQLLRTKEILRRPDVRTFPEVISVTRRPDGRYLYVVRDWFRSYPSPAEAFIAHGRLLRGTRYAAAWRHAGDPYAFIRAVAQAGYATAPDYADVVSRAMRLLERARPR